MFCARRNLHDRRLFGSIRHAHKRFGPTLCLWIGGSVGCIPADRSNELSTIGFKPVPSIPDVHTQDGYSGEDVILSGVVAVLPRSPGSDWLLVQDPIGGEYAGIEVHLHHGFPTLEISVGDVLTIRGRVQSSSGRMVLLVYNIEDIEVTGQTEIEPSRPGPVADWEPYNGVVVAPGAAELLDCGETAGWVRTDLDMDLNLSYLTDPMVLGLGPTSDEIRGVVHGSGDAWLLSPRSAVELGPTPPLEGCPITVTDARITQHRGRFVAPDVVVTAVQPDGTRAFVQDPGGGPLSGLELSGLPGDLSHLFVSDEVTVGGLLRQTDGPVVLTVTHIGPRSESEGVSTDTPDGESWTDWDGALVSIGPLEVSDASNTGRVETTAGIELADPLLQDASLPDRGTWTVQGALRVDLRTEPATLQLLPRSADDWTAHD